MLRMQTKERGFMRIIGGLTVICAFFLINFARAEDAVPGQDLFPKVQKIINDTQHGCMRCHGVGARIPLPTTEDGFFDVGSKWVSEDRDPAKSIIFTKMRGNPGGIMPPTNPAGFTPLSDEERALLAQWIKLGPVYNSVAVCKQRASEVVAFVNDQNDDQKRKALALSLSMIQNSTSEVDFDVNYADTHGEVSVKDKIKMRLIDVSLAADKIRKRCVAATFERE
jgi:hypothetical protein